MKYPTKEQIEKANHEQICKWHRFLPSPKNEEEITLINDIFKKFTNKGGMTTQISKKIGWS